MNKEKLLRLLEENKNIKLHNITFHIRNNEFTINITSDNSDDNGNRLNFGCYSDGNNVYETATESFFKEKEILDEDLEVLFLGLEQAFSQQKISVNKNVLATASQPQPKKTSNIKEVVPLDSPSIQDSICSIS